MAKKKKNIALPEQPETEKMETSEPVEFPNAFAEMFWRVNNIPVEARKLICQQCDWSIPTFYRKLRSMTRIEGSDGKVRSVSTAEMASIKEIYVCIFEDALDMLKAVDVNGTR